ncbi:MAG: aminoglycoside phosphotransferase family protein [Caldilineaceae bacterium]|nr:aminoglycoside phosphotransferase family protein [Caldilineaceae bacterium]
MTETTQPLWTSHHFLILPDATGSRILMLPSAEGWRLPYVRVQEIWLSESDEIIAALRSTLGLAFDFTILRYAAIQINEQERWDRILFVLEPRQPLQEPPLDGHWVDRQALYHMQLAQPEQRTPLLQYLEECEQGHTSPLIDPRRSPWARPGWFASAAAWIAGAIAEQGLTQLGPVEQLRNWSISSILFAPTSAGRVYFKAAAALPLFVNEPALTQSLSERYPGQVPTPLKIDRAQRWMLMKDFGAPARGSADVDFASILRAYGEFQRASAGHLDELSKAGCIDRRLPLLAAEIDPLISDPTTQAALEAQEYAALVALAPRLKERCAQVAAYNLPATLLHGDLHLGNIAQSGDGYLFFDWTDACIGFPFIDLMLLYFPEEEGSAEIDCRDAYLDAWRDFESPERLIELWELAKPLCALHQAVSYRSIVNNIEPLVREELLHGLPDNLKRILAVMHE